jgi:hypothetical protein
MYLISFGNLFSPVITMTPKYYFWVDFGYRLHMEGSRGIFAFLEPYHILQLLNSPTC